MHVRVLTNAMHVREGEEHSMCEGRQIHEENSRKLRERFAKGLYIILIFQLGIWYIP